MLDVWSANAVKEVDSVSECLLIVRLRANLSDLNIIVVFMPTSANEDPNIDKVHGLVEGKMKICQVKRTPLFQRT